MRSNTTKQALRTSAILILLVGTAQSNCLIWRDNPMEQLRQQLLGKSVGVDLRIAIPLLAEKVATPVPTAAGPSGGVADAPPGTIVPVHNLFSLPRGTVVDMKSMTGAIDPVGTSLPNDFDGDGILNQNETTTNIWVADYPVVETNIATPVTMRIAILLDRNGQSSEIVSEINSDDYESNRLQGSEKVHRNEVNERTVQYQDTYGSSNGTSNSETREEAKSNKATIGIMGYSIGGGGARGTSSGSSWGNSTSSQETTTKWADRPFKDNLDRDAWSVRSDSAALKSRRYRGEKRARTDQNSVINPNAGYVRAALYIKNLSTNMPVRLTNILCSLMFETPTGELVPVQSFRLRNEDFSLFRVDIYGDSEFGPYVVELANLNTVEIEKAIRMGYNPKIFVVSYDMTHVPDSNYRSMLVDFSGENLKIIEENAKGRTAMVQILAPQSRQMFRVSAFSTAGGPADVCSREPRTSASPGVPLRDVLQRIACSAVGFGFRNYVIDLSALLPGLGESRVFVPSIERVGGIANRIPCADQVFLGSDGAQYTACVQKPIAQWTEAELDAFGMWVVFADGRFYAHSEYTKVAGANLKLDGSAPFTAIPAVLGVDSLVWAGDHFNLVYITKQDIVLAEHSFGTNPLETGETIPINTRWDAKTVGEYPFDPSIHSVFLGKAGLGDPIEIIFRLKDTTYLDYTFGADQDPGGNYLFDQFAQNRRTYVPAEGVRLFSLPQAIDFEISLGLGGAYTDWFNIVRELNTTPEDDLYRPTTCGSSLDFIKQTFTVCIKLPERHDFAGSESVVNVYLRPALNLAYRNTVWPTPGAEVRKFHGLLAGPVSGGTNQLSVRSATGEVTAGDVIQVGSETALVAAVDLPGAGLASISLGAPLSVDHALDADVFVAGGLSAAQVRVSMDNSFITAWNDAVSPSFDRNDWLNPQNLPTLLEGNGPFACSNAAFHAMRCLGFNIDYLAGNWAGGDNRGNPFWNAHTDGSNLPGFVNGGVDPLLSAGAGAELRVQVDDPLLYGVNNFFSAPLIERNYDVVSRIK